MQLYEDHHRLLSLKKSASKEKRRVAGKTDALRFFNRISILFNNGPKLQDIVLFFTTVPFMVSRCRRNQLNPTPPWLCHQRDLFLSQRRTDTDIRFSGAACKQASPLVAFHILLPHRF